VDDRVHVLDYGTRVSYAHCHVLNLWQQANCTPSKQTAYPSGSFKNTLAKMAVTGGPIRLIVTASPRGSMNRAT
jgi:hypothetical protein